ncbi:hypothetical protein FH972_021620 [Carpinus fangiana]|uniref:SWIRM domain-containing protein n=1 Tax=Carpinus fangiana TaxID=176857 RepID=A0A5N6KQE7_9ROSI|nr:hypothetical protein FH972_021620 [Carpinus fangiana]
MEPTEQDVPAIASPQEEQPAGDPATEVPLDVTTENDVSMADDAADDSAKKSEAPSDNPLDAPDAPPAEGDDDNDEDAGGDEEDGDGDETKIEEAEPEKAPEDAEAQKDAIQESARAHLIAQTHPIVLPSYSTWFDMNTIHDNEKRALPEFFNSRNRSKTPAVYKDYRDFMINTYRLNPEEYLTFTACRRNLAGDVCAIMRVHAFLEQWGLINYQVDPETRPSAIAPPFTGHFRVIADTPRGLQPYQPSKDSKVADTPDPKVKKMIDMAPAFRADISMTGRRSIYDSAGKNVTPANAETATESGSGAANGDASNKLEDSLKEPEQPHFCNSCGIDCSREYYHNAKSAPTAASGKTAAMTKYDVCTECYREGHFPSQSSKDDYVHVSNPSYRKFPDRDRAWSDIETLRLLEGLELFDEDWTQVAEHVGSRTREQCIIKFLQLEIEDKYVDAEKPHDPTAEGALASFLTGSGSAPFSQAENPVMSVVSFLAGGVDPTVAAAAAGRSVAEMKRAMATSAGSSMEEVRKRAAEKGAVKPEADADDAMDLDTSAAGSKPNDPATTALALAAARSSALASHSERHMTSLLSRATSLQLQKLDLKLSQFAEMESLLQAERRDLERRRRELFLERLAWRRRCDDVRQGIVRVLQGPGLQSPEGVTAITEALGMVGIGGEVVELSLGKGPAKDADISMEGAGGDAAPAKQDDVKPVSEGDAGFRSHEI